VALTLQGVWSAGAILPPITPYFAMKVGQVPLVPYHRPGDPRVGDLVAARIDAARQAGRPLRAVMLDRLGPNVWHDSPAAAMATLEELEETARLWLLQGPGPRPTPLSAAQLAELDTAFAAPGTTLW
jgi:ribulose-5-phosphate 4-epimerase/fuculose-1-phosphate aldolase